MVFVPELVGTFEYSIDVLVFFVLEIKNRKIVTYG